MEQLSGRCRGHQGRPGQAQNKNRTKHGKPNTIASAGMKLTNKEQLQVAAGDIKGGQFRKK